MSLILSMWIQQRFSTQYASGVSFFGLTPLALVLAIHIKTEANAH